MPLFEKTLRPILSALPDVPWADGAVFNPGVWHEDGTVHMLFRAVPEGYARFSRKDVGPGEPEHGFENYISYIGYAHSRDGLNFTFRDEPFIVPDAPFDEYGAEDPRISKIGDRFYITYTALGAPAFGEEDNVRIGLASTRDFRTVEKHGVIGPPLRDKDAVLFPESGAEGITMLHRIHPDVQLVRFADHEELKQPSEALWREHLDTLDEHVILRPERTWEAKKIGMGPTPMRTDEGWLLIYHGVDSDHVYRAGLALLDLEDPRRVLARTSEPVLAPELDFERCGDVDDVVFPEGAALLDQRLHVYYGAADRVVGHAQAPLRDVLDLLREPQNRRTMPVVHFTTNGQETAERRSIETPPPLPVERMNGGAPLLDPDPDHAWESGVVLNPAAVLVKAGPQLEHLLDAWALNETKREQLRQAGGACVLLYRAQGALQKGQQLSPSALGLAVLTPELALVQRWAEPVIKPHASFHDLGVEDPRCTRIGDVYYLYYTGYSSGQDEAGAQRRIHICLATTRDFLDWTLHGPVPGDLNEVDNKNAALLPERVDGTWRLLHRPMGGRHPMAIHLAESDHPEGPFLSSGQLMSTYRYQEFALSWIGAAGPPISLGEGRFLMMYHQGHYDWQGEREYDLAAALLDFGKEPVVRKRIEPMMRPASGTEEQVCDPELGVGNVVFACANYRWKNDLIVPYAGADSRIFGGRLPFEKLVRTLRE